MGLVNTIRQYYLKQPLRSIMILATFTRIIAAIFSQGYGMHDDHFLVIEAPFSWTEGKDYANWLPWSQGENPVPSGHSLFYPGINFFLFTGMKAIGIVDPKTIMLFIRLTLGLFSLITVFYGYKIVEKLAGQKSALIAGLMLAIYWFMPFLSVRNLVEIITPPFFAIGFWALLKAENFKKPLRLFFLAGIITGIGVSVRFQSAILIGGIGLALLLKRKFFPAIVYGIGAVIAFVLIQGGIDYFVWGNPFTEFMEYFRYNLASKDAYGTDNMWMYIELLLGLLIPPVSIFLFIGFFKVWRKYIEIFLPVFLFIAFHTVFSNRQERFIFPVIPFFLILGVVGWNEIVENSKFWAKRPGLLRGSFVFFWVVNILLLIPITLSSSKKSRIEAMYYFFDKRNNINTILIDDIGRHKSIMMPVFYTGKTINTVVLNEDNPSDTTNYNNLNTYSYIISAHSMNIFNTDSSIELPQYIVFVEDIDIDKRLAHMKQYFPGLEHIFDVPPSMLDKVMKKLNPVNKNETFYIYKTQVPFK
jgi:hypothetical protein